MAATIATMATLNAKCLKLPSSPPNNSSSSKPATFRPMLLLQDLPKGLSISKPSLMAGAAFLALSCTDAALAAQQIADIAAEASSSDNRGLALLLPIIPAIGWVLFNILRPALNQLEKMRSEKGFVVGLGIGGGLAAAGLMTATSASAGELALVADAAASTSDSRGLLVLFVVALAIAWVLFNILQPALNQLDRMRS